MKSIFKNGIIALLVIMWGASPVQAQSVNMSRYITLTVKEGANIKLDFWADAAGTQVKVVSGNQEKTVTVGKSWVGYNGYTAGAGTMTVYGDVLKLDCNSNNDNITALDISHNTELTFLYCYKNALTTLDVSHNNKLKILYCYGNNFTTAAIDDIFCSLPDRKGQSIGEIQPVLDNSSSDNDIVLAANGKNATDKNWKVRYYDDNSDITGFTGNTECGSGVNMSRYITLTVEKGADILLDIAADADNTPIKIVSGDKEQTIIAGTGWTDQRSYTAGAGTMTVYGDVRQFDCSANAAAITALDVTNNTRLQGLLCYKDSIASLNIGGCKELKELRCNNNRLTSLDLAQCIALEKLRCSNNKLASLDVSRCTALEELYCYENLLTAINISGNNQLTWLSCYGNSLASLDISNNTMLERLYCFKNSLTSLDISNNAHLTHLCCYENVFTTAALDDIYCSLPDRKGQDTGIIQPVLNVSSPEKDKIIATNGNNALAHNWKVQYYETDTDVKGFTGTKQCQSNVNMNRYITLTVKKGAKIELDFAADDENTPVKIVSGTTDQTITVSTDWVGALDYVAGESTMTIYGNVQKLDCNENNGNITAIDASHNAQLVYVNCNNNSISSLDVSKNMQLSALYCSDNLLSFLDVSNNGQLEQLNCYNNKLTGLDLKNSTKLTFLNCGKNTLSSLDLSKNTQLSILYCNDNNLALLDISNNVLLKSLGCNNNSLTSLDVSKNTQLDILYCFINKLTSLDVSKNTKLKTLYCHSNGFTTEVLDDIYCSLPDRNGQNAGQIQPLTNALSSDKDKVLASNGNNAISRNWNIQYFEDDTDITGFAGTHQCTSDIDEAKDVPSFGIYPNPVKDILHITSDKPVQSIRVYNVYGMEVLYATDVMSINVSHLPAGVYIVRADSKVTRIIKE